MVNLHVQFHPTRILFEPFLAIVPTIKNNIALTELIAVIRGQSFTQSEDLTSVKWNSTFAKLNLEEKTKADNQQHHHPPAESITQVQAGEDENEKPSLEEDPKSTTQPDSAVALSALYEPVVIVTVPSQSETK